MQTLSSPAASLVRACERRCAGEELQRAVEDWQAKRSGAPSAPNGAAPSGITTGFLDGTHPIVDAYELKARPAARALGAWASWPACVVPAGLHATPCPAPLAGSCGAAAPAHVGRRLAPQPTLQTNPQVRLEHMLRRLRALQDAAATARPTRLLPHLWVAGAVEASRRARAPPAGARAAAPGSCARCSSSGGRPARSVELRLAQQNYPRMASDRPAGRWPARRDAKAQTHVGMEESAKRARARSLHLLRHLGITHLLNATEDLLLPEPGAGFQCAPPRLARRAAGPSLVLVQSKHTVALV